MCSTLAELKHDPLEMLELNNPENGIINVAGPVTIHGWFRGVDLDDLFGQVLFPGELTFYISAFRLF